MVGEQLFMVLDAEEEEEEDKDWDDNGNTRSLPSAQHLQGGELLANADLNDLGMKSM